MSYRVEYYQQTFDRWVPSADVSCDWYESVESAILDFWRAKLGLDWT